MKYGGEIYEGHHEPLISKKLFDSCQEVMSKHRKNSTMCEKMILLFLGLLKCASCGCSITAEKQKVIIITDALVRKVFAKKSIIFVKKH